jgi:hypothetical protein
MMLRITKIALLSAFALSSPMLTFAGRQYDKLQTASNTQTQNTNNGNGETPAVQQGKDSGLTCSDFAVRTETVQVVTPEEPAGPVCVVYGNHTCPNWNDGPAFHK